MYYTIDDERYIPHKPPSTMTVSTAEPESEFSGLYDAGGNKPYSAPKREPIGFIHPRDAA
jgi:hypothetical protein